MSIQNTEDQSTDAGSVGKRSTRDRRPFATDLGDVIRVGENRYRLNVSVEFDIRDLETEHFKAGKSLDEHHSLLSVAMCSYSLSEFIERFCN